MIQIIEGIVKRYRLRLPFGRKLEWDVTEIKTLREIPKTVWREFGDLAKEFDGLLKEDENEKDQVEQAAASLRVIGQYNGK